MDADEAVVLGAGLVAANLSTIFRLRQFGLTDKSMYEVNFSLNGEELMVLVPPMKKIPTKRAMKQTNITDDVFTVTLSTNNRVGSIVEPEQEEKDYGSFKVHGISNVVSKRGFSGKVALHTSVDSSGIFHVDQADATMEIDVEEKIPKKKEGSNSTEEFQNNNATSSNNTETIEYETRTIRKAIKEALSLDSELVAPKMTSEQLLASKKVLRELREKDRVKRETAKAKNDLEAYIIDTRSILNDEESEWHTFSTEEERNEAVETLIDAEDWMYSDESESANIGTFKAKLLSVRKIGDTILNRIQEASLRPASIKAILEFVKDSKQTASEWSKKKPWITEEETESMHSMLDELKTWVEDKAADQEKKLAHEDPVLQVSEMKKKLEEARRAFTRVHIKSKPIEKVKTETPKDTKNAEETPETPQESQETNSGPDSKQQRTEDDATSPDHSEL